VKTKQTAKQKLNLLVEFRQAIYGCFKQAGDALFELLDALLLSPRLRSFPELSCVPVFRRKWSSLYECLQDGRIDDEQRLDLCLKNLPANERLILIGDSTAWPRLYTETLEDCSIQHQPTPIVLQKPITVGHGYSTLGVVPEEQGSWFLPLLHERIKSSLTPGQKAAEQLKRLVGLLARRVLALFDSGYGNGTFFNQTAEIDCDLLVRVRPHRVLYHEPPPYCGRGRRRIHGPAFRLKDPQTWGKPDQEAESDDPKLGPIKVQCWHDLHFKDAPGRPFDLLRIERLNARDTKRDPKVVWLSYCAQTRKPSLVECWRIYLRRYTIEHWYRFIKRNLNWILPALSTPGQCQLWSHLILLASWEIFMAREVVKDQPRPWQKAQTELTPGRVQQSLGPLFAGIGTPARAPKTRGKSPGWKKGRLRTKRTRYPLIKKHSKTPSQKVAKRC
jgi:DDE superfamily endonuclease